MRDLDALLNSLVNIDRDSLIAILSSEAKGAERLANSIRTRTSTQRFKRQQAVARAARINRILHFIQHGKTDPDMSDADLAVCKSLEDKLLAHRQRGPAADYDGRIITLEEGGVK
jgi:hypothetical protein